MKKKLLPIALLSAMLLVACGSSGSGSHETSSEQQQSQSQEQSSEQQSSEQQSSEEQQSTSEEQQSTSEEQSSSSEEITYGVTIKNKATLLEQTFRPGDHADLDIELQPEANVMLEINKRNLVITSSNSEVISVTGAGITAMAEGTAEITATYHGVTDSLTLTVEAKITPKIKYGTVHEGTLEDPFDNADAIKVGKWVVEQNKTDSSVKATTETDLYIKGTVSSFYHAPGSRTDGAVSWFLEPETAGGEKFEIYKCYKEGSGEASYITDSEIWKGAVATAHGPITFYNEQMETSYATLDKVEGEKPADPIEIEATVAEALTVGKALADGDQTYDYYVITGYVVRKSGTNYFLADTETVAESVENTDLFELYNISDKDEQAKLLEGAKVTIKAKVKNYHGQIENGSTPTITVVSEGHAWSVPEPAVAKKTLAEFIAIDTADMGKHAYEVTAKVKSLDGADNDGSAYGNITLTDDTNDLVIYGCSATATALAWDGSAAYGFTNPKDFLTNEVTKAIKVGDTLKMKLIRADYKGTIQGKGIVLEVNPDEQGGGGETEPAVVAKTVAEFIALDAEDNGKHAYKVTAEVKSFKAGATVNDKYGNLVLTDGTNDLTIYGSTATESALAYADGAYKFTNPQDFQTNEVTKAIAIGDTVEMKLIRADYKGAVQGTGIILSVTPGQGGGGETVEEPAVVTKTLAEFIALDAEDNGKHAYTVTAEVKGFKNGATTNDQYGNLVLTDGENDLTIYGCSATATALVWDGASTYVFTNPKDFQTNETTAAIKIGDTVEMKLIRADYKGAVQGTGIVLSVTPGQGGGEGGETETVLAEQDFTGKSLGEWTSASGATLNFYASTGIKLNKEGLGVTSPLFAANSKVKVEFVIGAFNGNSASAASEEEHNFVISGLNAAGEVVTEGYVDDVVQGVNTVTLEGEDIVSVKIVYAKYVAKDGVFQNLGLSSAKVAVAE